MRLSVCVVTYNQEAYIAQCIESALAQQTAEALAVVALLQCVRPGAPGRNRKGPKRCRCIRRR